jgi:hypothetical protein
MAGTVTATKFLDLHKRRIYKSKNGVHFAKDKEGNHVYTKAAFRKGTSADGKAKRIRTNKGVPRVLRNMLL